jgi:nicotinamide-nucleotide amidase
VFKVNTAKGVAFLATGSEIIMGEILNTNGQEMAQRLTNAGVKLGYHMVADDDEKSMREALNYLKDRYDAIIITGGLGPTSDDKTRNVVAKACHAALVFNDESWERIEARMSKRSLPIPENNKQQAEFPRGATIFPNENGTADGCVVIQNNQFIFMLPGPPRECLPMFDKYVMPRLEDAGYFSCDRLHRWRLMGVSESQIAEDFEPLSKQYDIEFSYRAHYPYLDIKLTLTNSLEHQHLAEAVHTKIASHLVTTENDHISAELQHLLIAHKQTLSIFDEATKGAFANTLTNPCTHEYIQKTKTLKALDKQCGVHITGLDEYWNTQPGCHCTQVHATVYWDGKAHEYSQEVFLRGAETLHYAVEFSAHKVFSLLSQQN